MQYKSSCDPLYPVVIKGWRGDERAKFFEWALENIKGQFMILPSSSSGYIEHYTRPIEKNSYFGEPNDYSSSKEQYAGLILFSTPEDLSAFLIVFESVVEDRRR